MDSINKTLYIPLYGKSYVSKRGIFLQDPKAEEIWSAESFPLNGKAKSKWLAYYMGIRSAVFDDWCRQKIATYPDAVVLHLGCGLDSRSLRVRPENTVWYDVDFPVVIQERRRYYQETDVCRMIPGDLRESHWLQVIPRDTHAIVVMEGVSMYLTRSARTALLAALAGHFEHASLLLDCYTELAAKLSSYRNPVKEVGVSAVYGVNDPMTLASDTVSFIREHDMTPTAYTDELQGMERKIFKALYAGRTSHKLYRLYEYQIR